MMKRTAAMILAAQAALGPGDAAAQEVTADAPVAAAASAATPALDAAALIREVEAVMYPDSRSSITLHFTSKEEGRDETYEMVCYTRDNNQKVIVRVLTPRAQAGNDMLMVDQNVWAYDKRANRVMRVSSNQAFGGTGFSYGDIVRLNYSDNYTAVLTGQTAEQYELRLTAKDRNAPYHRIDLTVDRQGHWPVRSVHYARSGSVVKEVVYTKVEDVGAGRKPVLLTVVTPLDPGAVNVMTVVREEPKTLPDRIFNKRNLETRVEERL